MTEVLVVSFCTAAMLAAPVWVVLHYVRGRTPSRGPGS